MHYRRFLITLTCLLATTGQAIVAVQPTYRINVEPTEATLPLKLLLEEYDRWSEALRGDPNAPSHYPEWLNRFIEATERAEALGVTPDDPWLWVAKGKLIGLGNGSGQFELSRAIVEERAAATRYPGVRVSYHFESGEISRMLYYEKKRMEDANAAIASFARARRLIEENRDTIDLSREGSTVSHKLVYCGWLHARMLDEIAKKPLEAVAVLLDAERVLREEIAESERIGLNRGGYGSNALLAKAMMLFAQAGKIDKVEELLPRFEQSPASPAPHAQPGELFLEIMYLAYPERGPSFQKKLKHWLAEYPNDSNRLELLNALAKDLDSKEMHAEAAATYEELVREFESKMSINQSIQFHVRESYFRLSLLYDKFMLKQPEKAAAAAKMFLQYAEPDDPRLKALQSRLGRVHSE